MTRLLAILLNVFLLLLIAWNLLELGLPGRSSQLLLFAAMTLAPVASLAALVWQAPGEPRTWLGLWLRRKTMEERARLRQAESASNAVSGPRPPA